jgi:hypothetical protein
MLAYFFNGTLQQIMESSTFSIADFSTIWSNLQFSKLSILTPRLSPTL